MHKSLSQQLAAQVFIIEVSSSSPYVVITGKGCLSLYQLSWLHMSITRVVGSPSLYYCSWWLQLFITSPSLNYCNWLLTYLLLCNWLRINFFYRMFQLDHLTLKEALNIFLFTKYEDPEKSITTSRDKWGRGAKRPPRVLSFGKRPGFLRVKGRTPKK